VCGSNKNCTKPSERPASIRDLYGEQTLQLSKLLDLHLSRSIARLEEGTMSKKLRDISERMRNVRKAWDDRADALGERLDQLESRGDEAFRVNEAELDDREKAFTEMENDVKALEGNGEEGSGNSGGGFQGGGDRKPST